MGSALSLKKEVKAALQSADFEQISRLAVENRKVLGILISLSFNKNDVMCWRAIEAMGVAAGRVTREQDPELVRNTIRRITWSAREESGGMGWSAPELLGEIVRSAPRAFTDIPAIIVSIHEEDEEGVFHKGVLRALGRMADAGFKDVAGARELVIKSLENEDTAIRGLAVWAASRLGYADAADTIGQLADDNASFRFYENLELMDKTVGEMARAAARDLAAPENP